MKIKIKFSDFWGGFNPQDNYLFNTLSKYFSLELSDDPHILFFSSYGQKHLSYKCHKIQFMAENLRPDFTIADYAISFDYINDPRHLRLPLYVMYFDEQYTVEHLLRKRNEVEIDKLVRQKSKFCSFIISNPNASTRIDFFYQLSKYKHVDSGGRVLNNIGHSVKNKLDWVKNYKFTIAFENSSYPGYTTEKILEPKQVDTVPIYWGNPLVAQEINPRSFVSYHDYNSFDALIERVIRIDQDEELFREYLKTPLFHGGVPNEYFDETRLCMFFEQVVGSMRQKPRSRTVGFMARKQNLYLQSLQERVKNKFL